MKKAAALTTAVLMLVVGGRYSWLTYQGEIQPVLATWLLFYVAIILSFWTYWSSEKHSLISNVQNAVDTIAVGMILFSIIFLGKNVRLGFNGLELGCLIASGAVLVFWKMSKLHEVSNLTLQGIMAIAYLPTLYQLWQAAKNTESFGPWIVGWIASATALVPAIMDRDKLAIVYAARALIFTSILLGLMIRLELR